MRVDDFLGHFENVKGGDGQWYARCPAHDDREASLSIGIGRDGRRLLTCWAGCDLADVLRAARLSMSDLFETTSERALGPSAPWGDRPLDEADLPLEDELGRAVERLQADPAMLAYIGERKGWDRLKLWSLGIGKLGDRFAIPVRSLDGELVNVLKYKPDAQRKMLAQAGRPRSPLYLLHDEGPLFLVEGETDAISVAMLGFAVIGAPGAATKPKAEWLEPIRGRDVIVCMDVDKAGRKAAWRWASFACSRGAKSVRILTLEGPEKYDIGDLIAAGGLDHAATRRALLELVEEAAPFDPTKAAPELPPEPPELGLENGRAELPINGDVEVGTVILHTLSTYRMRRLGILWRDRIPVGRVGIIFGPPGLGKSTLLAMIMADVARAGGRSIIASAEDDPETTLVPRVLAAGAELSQIDLLATAASKGETGLVLPRDLDSLAERMREAALLIIDPMPAHLGDDVNSWREQDVRAKVLAPLAWHARITGCTVVLVMHINKTAGSDPLARISGSGGFGGAARFALLLGAHPDDLALDESEQRLALVHVKASETVKRRAMVFRREPAYFNLGDELVETSTLQLLDEDARISPEAVLAATDVDEVGAYAQAMTFLKRELGDGPKLAKRLTAAARERGDFSERTLRKAKHALGVESEKDSEGWWWVWNRTAR